MIALLGRGIYTVRRGAQAIVDLKPQYTVTDVFELVASIQPLTGDEMLRAPEGLRATHGIKIYAPLVPELRTVDVPGQVADVVYYDGRWYEIHRRQEYTPMSPIPHIRYEAYATETGRAYGLAAAPVEVEGWDTI